MNEETKAHRCCELALVSLTAGLRIKPLSADDMFLTSVRKTRLVNKSTNNYTQRQTRKGNRNGEDYEGSELGLVGGIRFLETDITGKDISDQYKRMSKSL